MSKINGKRGYTLHGLDGAAAADFSVVAGWVAWLLGQGCGIAGLPLPRVVVGHLAPVPSEPPKPFRAYGRFPS